MKASLPDAAGDGLRVVRRTVDPQAVREVCHDLRQPAATISALVAAAELEPGLTPSLRRRLRQILDESRRISEMVRHVLEETPTPEPLDAGEVAGEVVESGRLTYRGTLQLVAQANVAVIADRVALRRALANLLDNATRAAGPEGNVIVTVHRRGAWVQFEVSDSGAEDGIGGGAGLGLRIVEHLTASHGGDLTFSRSSIGGTQARLRLPAPVASPADPPRTLV